jgi:hypothetical protein
MMNSDEFLDQFRSYSKRYETWRAPINRAIESHIAEHNGVAFELEKLNRTREHLTQRLTEEEDLPGQIRVFLDQNAQSFLTYSQEECETIIAAVSGNFDFSGFLLEYARRAITKFQDTGEETWLIRGLIGIALEDCAVDFRDSLGMLDDLVRAGRERDIAIDEHLRHVALHASRKKSKGGLKPLSQELLYWSH